MGQEGDWGLTPLVYSWIEENIPKGNTILELGSGESSKRLLEMGYVVYSVEHDLRYLNKYFGVMYFYAPIREHKPVAGFEHHQWYDKDVVRTIPHNYSLIIVDGPQGGYFGRSGFLKYFDFFDMSVPIIFDDLHRKAEMTLAQKISAMLKKPLVIYTWEGKVWGYVK